MRGLTLGEMMVVLVVFGVLVIMFVLSSNQAMVKTKLSRVLSDTNMLSRAIANYDADNLGVPSDDLGLQALSTGPRKYLVSLPIDPFAKGANEKRSYEYLSHLSDRHHSLIISVGPDGDSDLLSALFDSDEYGPSLAGSTGNGGYSRGWNLMSAEKARALITEFSYDPTNGTMSDGDVITVY